MLKVYFCDVKLAYWYWEQIKKKKKLVKVFNLKLSICRVCVKKPCEDQGTVTNTAMEFLLIVHPLHYHTFHRLDDIDHISHCKKKREIHFTDLINK